MRGKDDAGTLRGDRFGSPGTFSAMPGGIQNRNRERMPPAHPKVAAYAAALGRQGSDRWFGLVVSGVVRR